MIFVSVGVQLPFDRMIRIVDEIAPQLNERVVAQTGRGQYTARNIDCLEYLSRDEFEVHVNGARVVVSHAGIGCILAAKKSSKPIIIFPREATLREHRNDHQLATAAALRNHQGVYVARSKAELLELLVRPDLVPLRSENSPDLPRLVEYIRQLLV